MKAIFVESCNGYLARGENDDMSWTPELDKKIFKLLTFACGGVYVCSPHTFGLLPEKMRMDKNRMFLVAKRSGDMSLRNLNYDFPNAILVGGPVFLQAAYDVGVIDTFVITTVKQKIIADERYKNPFSKILPQPSATIPFDDMTVRIYNKVWSWSR
ncbi:MAG: hypothetical protein J5742_02145 [Alphaproteobacteria bacterium]|nr:hypothetical protein [Alphaproteobacteria bacterium]